MVNLVATAQIDIDAPTAEVWKALTDPGVVARYFFGSRVETDWRPGSRIVWKGEYQGRAYSDHGEVLDVEPNRLLRVTHFSPLTGLPDEPQNYHTITYELDERGGSTLVRLSQDNNGDEAAAQHASENWSTMLDGLKRAVEQP